MYEAVVYIRLSVMSVYEASVDKVDHVYQGLRLTHLIEYPDCTLILMEAPSAALTVSRTDCIRFCALPTNISVASSSSCEPENTIFNNECDRYMVEGRCAYYVDCRVFKIEK